MIIEKIISTDRVLHYSSVGKMIRQSNTGAVFINAVDVYPCPYEYEETDEDLPMEFVTDTDKAEAYDILMGVKE